MATRESIIGRQVAADHRVAVAIARLAERHGVEAGAAPQLSRDVPPDFRAMIQTEVLADTLEVLAGNLMVEGLKAENSEYQGQIADLTAKVSALEATRAAATLPSVPDPAPAVSASKPKGK